jgi:uncharacterized protein
VDQFALSGLVALAGVLAGAVNTLAGGGTLLVYPALLAFGLPPIGANVTSLIGLTPGYVGGVYAYRAELAGDKRRFPALIPASVLGAIVGAVVLLVTPGEAFEVVIPFLVLFSSLLLLVQPWLQKRVAPGAGAAGPTRPEASVTSPLTIVSVFLASIYGSYFSAGVGVLLLALLGATIHANFQRINALKNALSLVIVAVGALVYAFSGQVDWLAVLVLLPSSALGGLLGGRLARRLNPDVLRYAVCGLGILLAVVLFR